LTRYRVSRGLSFLLLTIITLSLCARVGGAAAVTQAQLSSANEEILSAFASVSGAERSGGNVSSLDAKLNDAITLVQDAEEVNATNPARAAADLQNATAVAQSVVAESASAKQAGGSVRQATEATSLSAASAIVVVAALIYLLGGRVYRKAWLRLYRDYVVRPANG